MDSIRSSSLLNIILFHSIMRHIKEEKQAANTELILIYLPKWGSEYASSMQSSLTLNVSLSVIYL